MTTEVSDRHNDLGVKGQTYVKPFRARNIGNVNILHNDCLLCIDDNDNFGSQKCPRRQRSS